MTTGFTPRLLKGWWLASAYIPNTLHRFHTLEAPNMAQTLCGRKVFADNVTPSLGVGRKCARCLSLEARWLPEGEDTP